MMKRLRSALATLYDVFPVLNRPMAFCAAISLLAIIFLYRHIDSSVSLLVLFTIFAAIICFFAKSRKIAVISILFLAVAASAVNEFYTIRDLKKLDGQTVNADLIAIEDYEFTGTVSRVTVYSYNSDKLPANTKLSLYYYGNDTFDCGDKFNANIKISKINDDKYKLTNYGKSVYVSARLLKRNEGYKKSAFFSVVGNVRHFITDTIIRRFSGDVSATLLAVNAGNTEYLSDDFYNKVTVCGLNHIMVVSGLHLSIILGVLFRIFEKFFYNRFLKAAVSVAAIVFLCAVFGFTQSIIRAGAMFLFSAVAPLFMRKNDSLNSLGIAALLMMYFSPFCIFSVSFQLSVLATLAVVWVAPFYSALITEKLLIKSKIGKGIAEVMIISICAMIFTAPITIGVFGKVSLVSPFAFLLVTFPVTVALVTNSIGLLLSAFNAISFLSVPFFIVAGICTKYINFIIENLGLLDLLYIDVDIIGFFTVLFIIFALIATMYLYKFYQKLLRRQYVAEVKAHADYERKAVKNSNK